MTMPWNQPSTAAGPQPKTVLSAPAIRRKNHTCRRIDAVQMRQTTTLTV